MRRFLFLLVSSSILLAGPWDDFVQARGQGEASRNRWTFCVPTREQAMAGPDDTDYLRLSTAGDWDVQVLGKAQAEDLLAAREAEWALLAPGGAVAGVGRGRPTGAALLDVIHASGAQPRWEARTAFLQAHPDQGEARVDALVQELRMLPLRLAALESQGKVQIPAWHVQSGDPPRGDFRVTLGGSGGEAKADEVYRGLGEALRHLVQVPGWTRQASWVARVLETFDLRQSTSLRGFLGDLAGDLGERTAADPGDEALLRAWVGLEELSDAPLEDIASRVVPVPGTLWPTASALPILMEPLRRRGDLDRQQKLLADLTPAGPPQPLSPRGWEDYCELQAALLVQQAGLFGEQGSWDQARGALEQALTWGGGLPALRGALLSWGGMGGGGAFSPWNRVLAQLPTQKLMAQRPSPPPTPPGLCLTLMGRPSWLLAWSALRDAPDLALWSPGELRWDIATPGEFTRRQARHGWKGNPRWVLFRGDEVLATGETCPAPKALAGVLGAQGSPMLERLGRMLAQNPGHLAARRARFALLLTRMPDPFLEPLLVEDATAAALALPFGPGEGWKPDERLWGAAAQRILPDLEAELRSWPSDEGLWHAWTSWARFHPARPSIVERVESLAFWGTGQDWRATLPYGVQRAVAAELRRQGSFLVMDQWFQAAWDRLDQRSLKDLHPWERAWLLKRRAEEKTAIFEPLRDALKALGMVQQQLELERTFGAMTGMDPAGAKGAPLAR